MAKYVYVDWDSDQTREDVFWGDTVEEIREQLEERGRFFVKDYLYEVERIVNLDGGYAVYTDVNDYEAIVINDVQEGRVYWGELYKVVKSKTEYCSEVKEGTVAVIDFEGKVNLYGNGWKGEQWDCENWTNDEEEFEKLEEGLLLTS